MRSSLAERSTLTGGAGCRETSAIVSFSGSVLDALRLLETGFFTFCAGCNASFREKTKVMGPARKSKETGFFTVEAGCNASFREKTKVMGLGRKS